MKQALTVVDSEEVKKLLSHPCSTFLPLYLIQSVFIITTSKSLSMLQLQTGEISPEENTLDIQYRTY